MTIEGLVETYGGVRGCWGECPAYPRADWRYEVANGDTNLGYWEWLQHQLEMNEGN